jgi:ATP-binding cassette subfamily F protein 3
MSFVQLDEICLAFGSRELFHRISLHLSAQDRIALTGANGSGKTTLLKIIAGELKPDSGEIRIQKGVRISYLPQTGVTSPNNTLYEEVEKVFAREDEIIKKTREIEERLASNSIHPKKQKNLLEEYHKLQIKIQAGSFHIKEKKIEQVLAGLGFNKEQYAQCCHNFSDGFKMRIALAKVLLERADILLLDEPTNYLDIAACECLKDYINDYKGGVIVVSHDKYFLNSTVDRVAELFRGELRIYRGNYTDYVDTRKKESESLLKQYEHQQQEITRIEGFIRRFRAQASKAALVQSRIKELEKIKPIEIPPVLKRISLRFPPAPHSGRKVFEVCNISKAYNGSDVLKNVGMEIERGDRIALVGANGAGKSTLLRLLAGREKPDSGDIYYGKDVNIGYFSHDQAALYTSDKTVFEEIELESSVEIYPKLRNILGAFLFQGDDIHKKVSTLSGGELSRLLLLKLLLNSYNVLIFDEPTNHLDIVSKDILLEALLHYNGTLLFVSHDRYFLDSIANKVMAIKERNIKLYGGNYEYYLSKRESEIDTLQLMKERRKKENNSAARIIRQEETQMKNKLKSLSKELEHIIMECEVLEQAQKRLENSLTHNEVYKDGEKMKQLTYQLKELEERKQGLLTRWQEIEDNIVQIKANLH